MLPILKVNEDITLKLIDLNDVDAIFHVMDTQKDYIGEFFSFFRTIKQAEDVQKYIEIEMSEADKGLCYTYTILYKDSFAGVVFYSDIDTLNNKVKLGYWLNQDYQKKGIITQCVSYLTRYLLLEQGFNRLMIRCAKTNVKSQSIPKKLGYTLEVNEREAFRSTDGTYVDMYVYSKIKKDLDKTSSK